MATARRARTISATQQQLWEIVCDPHHLPRWWPGINRVEGVSDDAWTQVFLTKKGRPVRVDFQLLQSEAPDAGDGSAGRRSWEQMIPGTPFEPFLRESIIEIVLAPGDSATSTSVTIEHRQKPKGYTRTGGLMLRRSAGSKLDEALDGLERICGLG